MLLASRGFATIGINKARLSNTRNILYYAMSTSSGYFWQKALSGSQIISAVSSHFLKIKNICASLLCTDAVCTGLNFNKCTKCLGSRFSKSSSLSSLIWLLLYMLFCKYHLHYHCYAFFNI